MDTLAICRLIPKHPHIVRVSDFDVEEQTPYLVMDYAPHGTLHDRHPRGTIVPLPQILSYIKQVGAALAYTHEHKLIHRDVKPENMLLDEQNQLLLSDFGIAAIAHRSESMQLQNITGTVRYMAPEQFMGYPTPASDQYSLGIVVYEWLCGECPFQGGNFIEVGMKHATAPVPSLRQKVPTLVPEVEQVVLKALAKDQKHRFPHVQDFVQALEQAIVKELAVAPDQPKISSRHQDFPPTIAAASASLEEGCLLRCTGHTRKVSSVAWSPDGTRLASTGEDNTIRIWDAQTGHCHLCIDCSYQMYSVAWSLDGTRLATGGFSDPTVKVWDARLGGQPLLTYKSHSDGGTGKSVFSVAWSPDGTRLAAGGGGIIDPTVKIWDVRFRDKVPLILRGQHGVASVAWSPDGTRLASASLHANTIQIWDAQIGGLPLRIYNSGDEVTSVAWSPDGTRLAFTGMKNKAIQIWDAQTREKLLYTYHSDSDNSTLGSSVAWSPDGTRLASRDNVTVYIWQGR